MITLQPMQTQDAAFSRTAASLWTRACGPDLRIGARFINYNLRPSEGIARAGMVAMDGDTPVGFAVASHAISGPDTADIGWVEAIAVLPRLRRRGIGSRLLDWAVTWLGEQGCRIMFLGGGLRPFLPGLPAALGSDAFFLKRRFKTSQAEHNICDLACDLQTYVPVPNPHLKDNPQVRPLKPGEEGDLREFLQKEFSGRWLYEFEENMRQGDSISDYMVIWTEQGIEAFSLLTTEKSQRPLNRYYMHSLPHPWGQLGSVGVSERCRGRGYGVLIVDTTLQNLAKLGVRTCVVDWTSLVDFYRKFGFEPFRQYHILYKELI